MKKMITLVLAAILMLTCMTGVALAAEAGEEVTVEFKVENNPGFATFGAVISYDANALELVKVEKGALCAEGMLSLNKNTGKIAYAHDANSTGSGVLFAVTFKVKENAAAGTYEVTAAVDAKTTANENAEKVTFDIVGGTIVVEAAVCEHAWDNGVVTKAATCEEAGVMTYTCTKCGATKTEAIAALGHKWGEWEVTKAATCEEAGVETRVCANDKNHVETQEIKALGHKWGEWEVTKAPTCVEPGVETRVCANDKNHVETKEIEATGHTLTYKHDETHHWQVCDCGYVGEKEEHKFENNGYCVCGYKKPDDGKDPGLDDEPDTGDITALIVLGVMGVTAMGGTTVAAFKRKKK